MAMAGLFDDLPADFWVNSRRSHFGFAVQQCQLIE
jgi:hypothetical protein